MGKLQPSYSQVFISLGIHAQVPNLVQMDSPEPFFEIEDCAVLRFKTKLGKLINRNNMLQTQRPS